MLHRAERSHLEPTRYTVWAQITLVVLTIFTKNETIMERGSMIKPGHRVECLRGTPSAASVSASVMHEARENVIPQRYCYINHNSSR